MSKYIWTFGHLYFKFGQKIKTMNQDSVNALLDSLDIPVSKIENDLGMPSGTLAKAKKGVRELPDKWDAPLNEYFKNNCEPVKREAMIDVQPKTKMVIDNGGLKVKPSSERLAALKEASDKINRDFGAGTVMMFGDKPQTGYQTISTGSLMLNHALGIGGLPRGRIVEIFGWESSGKTTIALNCIADAQKQGLNCLLVDAENAFDPEYAAALGVNVDELMYCQPSYGEQGLEVADRQICTGKIGVVVIDSVAALVPKAELEGEHGDSKMGLHARLMSQSCRKMVTSVSKHNVLLIFINQFRHKIGVTMGNPEVTTGGNALQFYASVRLEVRRSLSKDNAVMNGDVKEGNQTTVKVIKNKCAPPFRQAQFNIMYGTGIDNIGEIVDLAVAKGVINKAGSWFSCGENKLGQGKDAVYQLLTDNEELKNEIESKLK